MMMSTLFLNKKINFFLFYFFIQIHKTVFFTLKKMESNNNNNDEYEARLGKRDRTKDRTITTTIYEVVIDGEVVATKTDFQDAHTKMMKLTDDFTDEIVLRKTPINIVVNKDANMIAMKKPCVAKNGPSTKELVKEASETRSFYIQPQSFETHLAESIIKQNKGHRINYNFGDTEGGKKYYYDRFRRFSDAGITPDRNFASDINKILAIKHNDITIKPEADCEYIHQTRFGMLGVHYFIIFEKDVAGYGFYVTTNGVYGSNDIGLKKTVGL